MSQQPNQTNSPEFSRAHRSGGYTLVEVLMVVMIMGIAAAMVMPRMKGTNAFTAEGALRAIIADLAYAQNDAVALQQGRRVVFDVENNQLKITDDNDNSIEAPWLGGSYVIDLSSNPQYGGVQIESVDFDDETTLRFDDMGGPSAGGTIRVRSEELYFDIVIAPLTGRTSVVPVDTSSTDQALTGKYTDNTDGTTLITSTGA